MLDKNTGISAVGGISQFFVEFDLNWGRWGLTADGEQQIQRFLNRATFQVLIKNTIDTFQIKHKKHMVALENVTHC